MTWRNAIGLGAIMALSALAVPAGAQQLYYQAQAAPPGRIEAITPGEPYVYPPGHWELRGGMPPKASISRQFSAMLRQSVWVLSI